MNSAPRLTREAFEHDVMLWDEVADYLRIDAPNERARKARVLRLVASQGLTAHRVGRTLRFVRTEVERWLALQESA